MSTRLNITDEAAFQNWYRNLPTVKNGGISPNPDDPEHLYDFRRAFLSGVQTNAEGHFPSQFKQIGHPRYFLNGRDTTTGQPTNLEQMFED